MEPGAKLMRYWAAADVAATSDRRIVIETVYGTDMGMLLTISSTVANREATIILSKVDLLELAQLLSDDFGPVKMPKKD